MLEFRDTHRQRGILGLANEHIWHFFGQHSESESNDSSTNERLPTPVTSPRMQSRPSPLNLGTD